MDLDGLLVDSEPAWKMADELFLARRNVEYAGDLEGFLLGVGQQEAIGVFRDRFDIQGGDEELIAERRALLYQVLLADLRVMGGATDLVSELARRGMLLAVATGGHDVERARDVLRRAGLEGFFSLVVSSDEVKRGKPHPDVFLLAAERLDVVPDDCLVLEDAPNGVLAARAAAMRVIGVNSDEAVRHELWRAGADMVVGSLTEIVPVAGWPRREEHG
ncbi:MAG: HAD family phosphatase [Chloroflexi bacterium]|nr:HAD family phosphatase [Chloroflexota bacterium]